MGFSDVNKQQLLTTAKSYSYVRETQGNNRSPEIDSMLRDLGLPVGQPWCMAFQQRIWKDTTARCKFNNPMPRGVARVSVFLKFAEANPYKFRVKSARSLMMGAATAKPGDMTIHVSGFVSEKTNFNGHIEMVAVPDGLNYLYAWGGNTGPDANAKARSVEQERNASGATAGVHYRHRSYGPKSNFRIAALVEPL
jgi:hypothetical protein